jgi:uncharacterized short protein YbdD (DUF466 family)
MRTACHLRLAVGPNFTAKRYREAARIIKGVPLMHDYTSHHKIKHGNTLPRLML